MTMHLEKPYLTTTRHGGKRQTSNSARSLKSKQEHEKWLKSKGLHPDQLQTKLPRDKTGRRLGVTKLPDLKIDNAVKLSNQVDGPGYVKPITHYTGTEIIGVATLHKSVAVPVLRGTDQAKEISAMRR